MFLKIIFPLTFISGLYFLVRSAGSLMKTTGSQKSDMAARPGIFECNFDQPGVYGIAFKRRSVLGIIPTGLRLKLVRQSDQQLVPVTSALNIFGSQKDISGNRIVPIAEFTLNGAGTNGTGRYQLIIGDHPDLKPGDRLVISLKNETGKFFRIVSIVFSAMVMIASIVFFFLLFSCSDKKPGMLSASGYYYFDNKWHFYGGFSNAADLILNGADSATFEKLDERFPQATYARDKNKAYYNGKVIPGAHGASFSRIRSYLSKDDARVFYMSSELSDDPSHFSVVDENVTKDGKRVYWGDQVISDDPNGFNLVGTASGLSYYTDREGVIANFTRLPNADPGTFQVLSHGYSKDSQTVFLIRGTQLKLVEGADPATFKVLSAWYTSDASHVYWNGERMQYADPVSFRILNEEAHCSADQTQAYHRKTPIPGSSPATFPRGKSCKSCTDAKIVF